MNFLEKKIPPPIVFLITLLLIKVSSFSGLFLIASKIRIPLALLLIVIGIAIDIVALLSFCKMKTTINPLNPSATTSLVTTGIYAVTRNPMYLGLVFILLGASVYLENLLGVFFIALFIAYISRLQIFPEERVMQELFKDEFNHYCQQVRRWI